MCGSQSGFTPPSCRAAFCHPQSLWERGRFSLLILILSFPEKRDDYLTDIATPGSAIAAFACISRVRALWLGCVLCVVRVRALWSGWYRKVVRGRVSGLVRLCRLPPAFAALSSFFFLFFSPVRAGGVNPRSRMNFACGARL